MRPGWRELGRKLGSPAGIALTYFLFGLVWIFASDRVLSALASNPDALTQLQTYKGWAYVSVSAALLYGLAVTLLARVAATQDLLKQTRGNFRRVVESSQDGMWAVDTDGRVAAANGRIAELLGVSKEDLLGEGVKRYLLPEPTDPGAPAKEGPGGGEATPRPQLVQFRRSTGETGWGIVASVKLMDAHGKIIGEARVLTDVTHTRRTEEALRMSLRAERTLLNELDHRVRNNLASLLALVELTKRNAVTVDDFARLMRARVGAMAATHSLLSESKFATVDLTRLIDVITDGEADHRLLREGPPVLLGPSQAGPMAMILQETWTNSMKHGALGSEGGRARVSWEIAAQNGSRLMRLTWRDEGGPRVRGPVTEGFGLSLVRGLATSDLHGRFDADFAEAGASFRIEFPMTEMEAEQPLPRP